MADGSLMKETRLFEDVMLLAGGKGRWEVMFFCWMLLIVTTIGYCNMAMAFMGETPAFLCADGQPKNATFASLSETAAERCRAPDGQPCRRWLYDSNFTGSSVVTQWDLVCERRPLLSMGQSILQFGGVVGAMLAGFFSDRFGRKIVQHIMISMFVSGSFLSAVSSRYELFLLSRFITGIGMTGSISCCVVLVMELIALEWRVWAGQLLTLPLPLGEMLLAAAAYKLRVWWHLQLALSAPMLIFVLSFWLVPESPRWLFVQGRDTELLRVLAAIARVNGRQLPEESQMMKMLDDVRHCEMGVQKTASETSQLWRSPLLRRWILATCFCWAGFNAAYYGLSFGMTQLSESRFVAGVLSGLVAVPGSFLSPLIDRLGRRPVTSVLFLLTGVFMMLVLINDDATLMLVLGLAGKLFISGVQSVLCFYTPEYIPTSVRAVGYGLADLSARFGAMVAPFIVDLIGDLHDKAPSLTFGAWSLLAGLASLLLPETTGRPLPETVAQLEAGILDRPQSDSDTTEPDAKDADRATGTAPDVLRDATSTKEEGTAASIEITRL